MNYQPIKFPQDGNRHNNIIEWWYFNGSLRGDDGREYAFMNCLFQADTKKVNIPFLRKLPIKKAYFAHALLSEIGSQKFHDVVAPIVLVAKDSFTKPRLSVDYMRPVLDGYFNYVLEEIAPFKYRIKTEYFDLILTSRKSPLLEGGRGYLDLATKSTYYYSLTNLQTEGYVTIGDRRIRVKGKSWFDHQWADAPYAQDKWTWFSIQLDNQTELVCFEFGSGKNVDRLVSIISKNGKQKHTTKVIFNDLGDYWTSNKTLAKYPLAWEIIIPEFKMSLRLSPLIRHQEMVFGSINYWEGPLKVQAEINGKKVGGQGFMELVGYPMKRNKFVVLAKHEQTKIKTRLHNYFKALGK